MKVCIKYDKRPPNLPVAVAGSRSELARMLGVNVNVVHSALSHHLNTYFEMEFDEREWWPDNNGGEWTYGPNQEVIYRD